MLRLYLYDLQKEGCKKGPPVPNKMFVGIINAVGVFEADVVFAGRGWAGCCHSDVAPAVLVSQIAAVVGGAML